MWALETDIVLGKEIIEKKWLVCLPFFYFYINFHFLFYSFPSWFLSDTICSDGYAIIFTISWIARTSSLYLLTIRVLQMYKAFPFLLLLFCSAKTVWVNLQSLPTVITSRSWSYCSELGNMKIHNRIFFSRTYSGQWLFVSCKLLCNVQYASLLNQSRVPTGF